MENGSSDQVLIKLKEVNEMIQKRGKIPIGQIQVKPWYKEGWDTGY